MRRTRKCSSKTKWRRMTRRVRVSFKRMLLVLSWFSTQEDESKGQSIGRAGSHNFPSFTSSLSSFSRLLSSEDSYPVFAGHIETEADPLLSILSSAEISCLCPILSEANHFIRPATYKRITSLMRRLNDDLILV